MTTRRTGPTPAPTSSPGCSRGSLFLAGFARLPRELQQVYALLELLRGVAAFAFAPVVLSVATQADTPAAGIRSGVWACVVVAAAGGVLAVLVVMAGGVRPRPLDIDAWIADRAPALESPPLGAALRATSAEPGVQ